MPVALLARRIRAAQSFREGELAVAVAKLRPANVQPLQSPQLPSQASSSTSCLNCALASSVSRTRSSRTMTLRRNAVRRLPSRLRSRPPVAGKARNASACPRLELRDARERVMHRVLH